MNTAYREWKNTAILGFLILVLGFVVRVYQLTYLPVFGDEAIYIRWSQIMNNEPTLRFIPLSDGKQPLFMWFMMPFLKIFYDPLYAGRLAAVVCGGFTMIGIFVLSYLLFKSKKVSLLSMLVYSIAPFGLFFDKLALADSMLSMFGVWVFVFILFLVKTIRFDAAIIAGFMLGGALLTKSPALYFSLLAPISFIFIDVRNLKDKFKLIKLIFFLALVYLISYGFYNFLLHLGPNFHMITLRNKDYVFPISHLWQNPKDPFIFHFDRTVEWFVNYGTLAFFFLFIGSVVLNIKKFPKQIFFLLALLLVPILANSMFAKSFTTRYIYFTFPYFVIIGSSIFLEGRVKSKAISVFVDLLIIAFVFQSAYFFRMVNSDLQNAPLARTDRSGFLEEWTSGTGIRETADFIIDIKKADNRKIVVGTEGYFGTLPDGLQMYLARNPEITVIGVGIDLKEIPTSLLESKAAGNLTYLVINSSRLKMDLNNPRIKILAAYPKAFRPNFVHEYTLHGERDTLYLLEII